MGAFHRRLEVATCDLGDNALEGRAVVEDDFHHFRVTVRAQDGIVREVLAEQLRNPNTLCPAAGLRLRELHGMKVSPESTSAQFVTDAREQCTHQLDLAGLAVASIGQRRAHCLYEAVVPDRVAGKTTATLRRDGRPVLSWDVDDMTILSPHPGVSLGAGFTRFTRSLAPDAAEAALVLRRAVFVSQGRDVDVSDLERKGPIGGCYAWQPSRTIYLTRIPTARQDFTNRSEQLGIQDGSWLRFEP